MSIKVTAESLQSPFILLQFICWRLQKFNIVALDRHLGDKEFLRFLSQFAGCYIKLPPAQKIYDIIDDYKLYLLNGKLKDAYRNRRLMEWETLDRQFNIECKKRRIRYDSGRKLVQKVTKEIGVASNWYSRLKKIEEKQEQSEV